jgi:hypothetical protein
MSANQRWLRVLQVVDTETRRAEALLARARDADATLPEDAFDAGVELPPLEEMPPLPDELASDVQALRVRIAALQDGFGQAMQDWRPAPEFSPAPAPRQPVYVDRCL